MNKIRKQQNSEYNSSLKSLDTEETFDLIFYRPVGYFVACVCRRLGIKPNAITIVSIFLGIGAGIMLYFNNIWVNLGGMALLVMADIGDSADGQLARLTKQYSRLGRILDGMSGDIWFVAIYVAICLRENVTSEFFMAHQWVIWVVAAVTGFCHAIQAAMADYYRQFHLLFVNGVSGTELEDSAARLWEKFHSMSWRHDFFAKLTLLFYAYYTSGQEKRTPWMQRLRRLIAQRYGTDIPADFSSRFRAASKPLMKYTNILSFNTRAFSIFIFAVILRMPWLYFAFELTILNILLIYMMCRHESICRRLARELQESNN